MSNTHESAFSATKILLPIEFSPSSAAALEAAAGMAQQFHAGIHLVHIVPEIPEIKGADFFAETAVLQQRRETLEQKLDACTQQLMQKGVPASFSIESGNDIVGTLMRVIKQEHTDLLVLSTHGMSGWQPLVFGSIAEQVIKQVNCTLLLLQSNQVGSIAEEVATEVPENSSVPQLIEKGRPGSAVHEPVASSQKRLDRIADDMAGRGAGTEKEYDQNHPVFTK